MKYSHFTKLETLPNKKTGQCCLLYSQENNEFYHLLIYKQLYCIVKTTQKILNFLPRYFTSFPQQHFKLSPGSSWPLHQIHSFVSTDNFNSHTSKQRGHGRQGAQSSFNQPMIKKYNPTPGDKSYLKLKSAPESHSLLSPLGTWPTQYPLTNAFYWLFPFCSYSW